MGSFGDVGLLAFDRHGEGLFILVVFVFPAVLLVGGRTGDPVASAGVDPSISTHRPPLLLYFLARLYFLFAQKLLERGSFAHLVWLWWDLLCRFGRRGRNVLVRDAIGDGKFVGLLVELIVVNFGVFCFLFGGGPRGRVGLLLVDLVDSGGVFGHG